MEAIILLLVLGTSIWVLFDAKAIGVKKGQTNGITDMGHWGWFFACLLLWIVCFPLYLSKRSEYKKINSEGNVSLNTCKDCGHNVSVNADNCPNCGAVLKKKTGMLSYLMVGFLVLVVFGIFGSLMTKGSNTSSSKPEAGFKMPSIGKQIVTFDEYKKIQNVMSYRQVIQIIGAEGEEMSRSKMDGVPGVMESVETVMFQWVNGNGSNMNAIFQNDKLIQKAQFGLK